MRSLIVAFALFAAAACGGKSKPPVVEEPTGDDTESAEGDGTMLDQMSPELDALNTEVGSIRDLPVEERDVEACDGYKGLARMVGDLDGAVPQGVDEGAWNAAIDDMSSALDAVKKACPDDVDALDAAFTQLLDALDGIVETTQTTAVGPPA